MELFSKFAKTAFRSLSINIVSVRSRNHDPASLYDHFYSKLILSGKFFDEAAKHFLDGNGAASFF